MRVDAKLLQIMPKLQILLDSPGARDQLWPSRLLRKLANFNFTRIIPWTLVVNAGVAVETL